MTGPAPLKRNRLAAAAVLAILLVAGVVLALVLPRQTDEQVALDITCASGADVTGVWVEAANGGSGFAERTVDRGPFVFILSFGGPYHVNVGCGGTRQSWAVGTSSSRNDHPHRTLKCEDRPGHDRTCRDEPGP